jgi:hypothetical protein
MANHKNKEKNNYLLPRILVDSESCGTDSLLCDAHDTSDIFVIFPYFVKDEEEGIMNSLGMMLPDNL